MKFFLILVFVFNFLSGCSSSSLDDVKKFGKKKFTSENWKSSNNEEKSEMIYSFLNKNDITKFETKDIYNLLGKSTTYYEYDEFPAYLIKSEKKEYILAFPINRKTNKIRAYVITPLK